MKMHFLRSGLVAGLLLAASLSSPVNAQMPPDVGFRFGLTCPGGYVLTETAAGPECVQEINQATNAQNADTAQNAVQAQTATTATSATTAGTALNLDPNAQIDAGNIGGLPNCNDGRVLTKTPLGFECVQVATGERGFANKAYIKVTGNSWVVPSGVFKVRVTAAAGATELYRQDGYYYNSTETTGPHWTESWGGCEGGWSWNHHSMTCSRPITVSGCNQSTFTTAAGKSATKTYDVTPGQVFRATLQSTTQMVSRPHPHSLCSANNYDKSHQIIADVPEALGADIYWDARNGEYPGEESATSSMIVEW